MVNSQSLSFHGISLGVDFNSTIYTYDLADYGAHSSEMVHGDRLNALLDLGFELKSNGLKHAFSFGKELGIQISNPWAIYSFKMDYRSFKYGIYKVNKFHFIEFNIGGGMEYSENKFYQFVANSNPSLEYYMPLYESDGMAIPVELELRCNVVQMLNDPSLNPSIMDLEGFVKDGYNLCNHDENISKLNIKFGMVLSVPE